MKKSILLSCLSISLVFTSYASAGEVITKTEEFPEWTQPKLVYTYIGNKEQPINLKQNETIQTKYYQTPHAVNIVYYKNENSQTEKDEACRINGEIPQFSDWNNYKTVTFHVTYDTSSEQFKCEGVAIHK